MNRFKSFLTELEILHDFTRRSDIVTRKQLSRSDNPKKGMLYDYDTHGHVNNPVKYHSTLPSGHQLYYRQFDSTSGSNSGNVIHNLAQATKNKTTVGRDYYAVDPKTNLVHLKIYGQHVHENKNKSITMTPHVSGRPGGDVKAHDVYHHLITKHDHILHTGDRQSPGGKKVWFNLAKMPGVNVFGYKEYKNNKFKALNVEPHHEDEVDKIYANPELEDKVEWGKKTFVSKKNVTLVAHKKID